MKWLENRWTTIKEAVGVRRFIFASVVLAVLGAIKWLVSRGSPWASQIPTWSVMIIVPLVLLLWWLLEYANRSRLQAIPALRIEHGDSAPFSVTEPSMSINPAVRTIRIKVTNTGQLNLDNCLVKLEEMTSGGRPCNVFV
ncbi:MAG: hypothetical protein WAW96_19790, partial [Alphaproteobacteria bacterium]